MKRLVPVAGAVLVLGPLSVLVFLVAPGRPGPPPDSGGGAGPVRYHGTPVVQPEARRLLTRAARVPSTTAYRGVQFVSAWSSRTTTSEVVSVDHDPARGTTVRRDGTTSVPARSLTVLAGGSPSIATGGAVGVLAAHYSLSVVGTDRVAGRVADVVAARRTDARRGDPDAARFWLDRASGLVLRREVYDRRGRTIRASAFVEVTVGQPGTAPAGGGTPAARAWPTTLDPAAVRTLRRNGWHCPKRLPGRLSLVDARRAGGRPGIVHLSYSDGIATVSLFEQRGRLPADGPAGLEPAVIAGQQVWVGGDLPRRVAWASGGTVYTLVADAPERTVERVVAALPHGAAADDPLGRLGRGLDRVASWFNPFA